VPDQVEDLEDADLVLVLAAWLPACGEQVADAGRRDGARALDGPWRVAARGATRRRRPRGRGERPTTGPPRRGEDGDTDPHVWLDPNRMADIADEVAARSPPGTPTPGRRSSPPPPPTGRSGRPRRAFGAGPRCVPR
jgi:zinc transport system substrate-binding protein